MKNKIITLGEIMLRLSPAGNKRFVQADSFEATFGGGEANVAVSLSNYGKNAAFVTKLPANEIGRSAANELRKYGVDTSFIVTGGDRIGIYFLEKGASQRPSKVIYDRKNSSIAEACPSDFDFDNIFENAAWFHFTGITPALSQSAADICFAACKKAKEKGITVSCDINYRKNLWSKAEAQEVMSKLMPYVDVCIANEEDAANVFGIKSENTNVAEGNLDKNGYQDVAKALHERFNFKKVAITLRSSVSANDNIWQAMLYDGNDFFFGRSYPIHIVDRVGAGDSFAAALIYSHISDYSPRDAIEFATAASCLKHSIEGDFNLVTVQEVQNLVKGDASGRVQR